MLLTYQSLVQNHIHLNVLGQLGCIQWWLKREQLDALYSYTLGTVSLSFAVLRKSQ